jgi:regulator of protease activity HflC (stomatin/prohibitin superfamily)
VNPRQVQSLIFDVLELRQPEAMPMKIVDHGHSVYVGTSPDKPIDPRLQSTIRAVVGRPVFFEATVADEPKDILASLVELLGRLPEGMHPVEGAIREIKLLRANYERLVDLNTRQVNRMESLVNDVKAMRQQAAALRNVADVLDPPW